MDAQHERDEAASGADLHPGAARGAAPLHRHRGRAHRLDRRDAEGRGAAVALGADAEHQTRPAAVQQGRKMQFIRSL